MIAACILAHLALAAEAGPPAREVPAQPIAADDQAAAICPDRHAAELLFRLTTDDLDPEDEAALRQRYDRAVARWAVCARVMGVTSWGVPELSDPAAEQLRAAALTEPGRRQRQEALERAAQELPVPAGLLALEELSVLAFLSRAEPPRRLALAAAALGPWGCGSSLRWETGPDGNELGYCADGRTIETMATAGIQRLVQLATQAPPADRDARPGWLALVTDDRVEEWWRAIEAVRFPLHEPAPLRVAEAGLGSPLEPGLGWSGRISPSIITWQERPSFTTTRRGISVQQPALRSSAPDDWDATPVLYIDADVRIQRLAEALTDAGVRRPIFVARRAGSVDPEDLVELRMQWDPGATPPPTAVVLDLQPIGGSPTRMQADAQAAGPDQPVWLHAHPELRYGDLVRAHAAVSAVHAGPIRVGVQRPSADAAP